MGVILSLLLPLLLLPGIAHAGVRYAITCQDIQVLWEEPATQGEGVMLQLTIPAAKAFETFTTVQGNEDISLVLQDVTLSRLQLLAPEHAGRVWLHAGREGGAQLARTLCPDKLKPIESMERDLSRPLAPLPESISPTFPIACDDVQRMELGRLEDVLWKEESLEGALYQLEIVLTAATADRLADYIVSVEPVYFLWGDLVVHTRHVELLAQGMRVRSEAPLQDAFARPRRAMLLLWRTLPAALAAARAICPEKVPRELRVLDQTGQEQGREALPVSGVEQ
ncbi:hypothetical protein [Megalodesulfovibrio paquesii]